MRDIVVGDALVGRAVFVRDGLVAVVLALRVVGDDVPGMQEAGEVAQDAEGDVDEGVGGAEPGLDPDCGDLLVITACACFSRGMGMGRFEERVVLLNLTRQTLCHLGKCLPAIGGKRMAMNARKRSPHDMSSSLNDSIWFNCDVNYSWW